jgi:hypothetical protein
MKAALAAATILLLAGPAMAAPGDPRALRGRLEWPATLSAEPFIVVRGDDGRVYYANVSTAQRMSAGAIAGPISLVGVEGNQPHEIAAVAVGAGDSALTVAPAAPAPPPAAAPPSSLPRQAVSPMPSAAAPSAPPAAPQAASEAQPGKTEDLWRIQGRVMSVSSREFVIETRPGETVHVDVSKLSSKTRDAVQAGDHVQLFGVPQKDQRLVANGFIQELPPGAGSR